MSGQQNPYPHDPTAAHQQQQPPRFGGGRGVVPRGGGGGAPMMGRGPMPGVSGGSSGGRFHQQHPQHQQYQQQYQQQQQQQQQYPQGGRGGGGGVGGMQPPGVMNTMQHYPRGGTGGGGRFNGPPGGGPAGRGQGPPNMMPPRGGPMHPSAPYALPPPPPPPPPPPMGGRGAPRGGPMMMMMMMGRGERMPIMHGQNRPPPFGVHGRGPGMAQPPQAFHGAHRLPMPPPPPPPPPPRGFQQQRPPQYPTASMGALPPPPPPPPPPSLLRPTHGPLPGYNPAPGATFHGQRSHSMALPPPPPPPPPPRGSHAPNASYQQQQHSQQQLATAPTHPGATSQPYSYSYPSSAPAAHAASVPAAPTTTTVAATPAPLTAAPAAAPAGTVAATDHPAPAWTEHSAPNGMKYYYNSVTKESTYHRPDALKQQQQQQSTSRTETAPAATTASATLAASGPSAAVGTTTSTTATAVAAIAAARQWREYQDAASGKPYYSDGITTTWDKPPELGGSAGAGASGSGAAAATARTGVPAKAVEDTATPESTPPRRNKRRREADVEFGSKEEAVAAFKGMLLAKDVSPTLKWNEVAKICAGDVRWEACEDALTVGERKQALAEYQTKRANDLRELERQERSRAKAAFTQMLSSMLPGMPGFSWWSSRFADVRDVLAKDDRFHAVADEGTRESLFLDFCEECRKREERKKKSKRQDAHDSFLSFLSEKEDNGEVSYSSTWESFFASLTDADKSDSRFILLPERSNEDRQVYFADFVLELQAREDDKRRRIREARQRAQQEQKDAFREFLAQLAVQGKLLPSSRWRHIEEVVSAHPSFAPVKAQDPELPREVFEEFANAWNARYLRDRTFLSQLVYPSAKSDVLVKADTSFDEFTRALLDRASEDPSKYESTRAIINREIPMSSARLYFNELSMRARGVAGPAFVRRGSSTRRGHDTESSEDEGEIVEDGELILE